jgi:uncharacterized membrane protein
MKRTVLAPMALFVIPPTLCFGAVDADTLLRFTGRLHPSLVHFPIALLIVAALLEVVRLVRRKPEVSPSALTCVVIAAVAGAVVAFSGWMNADYETHGNAMGDTLFWHRWLGVSVAAVGVIVAAMGVSTKFVAAARLKRMYALLLIAAAAMVGFTGHLGGSMVWGPDYMFEVFGGMTPAGNGKPDPKAPARTPPSDAVLTIDFAKDVQPIFTKNCVECHGPSKKKGGLRLDDPGYMFGKAQDAWVVVPGSPEKSDLVRRISLDKEDRDRMPPKGDPLPAEQVEKLRKWVAEGAYWSEREKPIEAPPAIKTEPAPTPPAAVEQPAAPAAPAWSGDEVAAIEAIRKIGGRAEPIAAGSTDLDVNLSLAGAKATDEVLGAVARLGARVKWLNLARTAVTDAGVGTLKACTGMEKLHLEGTGIGDAAVEVIAGLPRLSYLNLDGTKVTDAGIAKLAACKTLKDLYVADTKVTLEGAIRLQAAVPGVNVELGVPKP